jgi:hypothetical protein
MTRLKYILKFRITNKFKKGYSKYIKSLSYKEYEKLFLYYSEVINVLRIRYEKKERKFLSKFWIKEKMLLLKYHKLYRLFVNSNPVFMVVLKKNLDENNKKTQRLIDDINEAKELMNKIYSKQLVLNIPPTQEDNRKFIMLMLFSFDLEEKVLILSEKLNKNKN